MTEKSFDEIVENRCNSIKHILSVKAKEYRRNGNPLHNFERGAYMTGNSSLDVLDGFLLKHLVSYRDMLDDIKQGNIPSEELVNEKFGDIINYFVLQEALIKDIISNER